MPNPMAPALPGLADAATACPTWCAREAGHTDHIHLSEGTFLVLAIEHLLRDGDDVIPAFLGVWAQISWPGQPATVMVALNENIPSFGVGRADVERLGRLLLRAGADNATPGIHRLPLPDGHHVIVERSFGAVLLSVDATWSNTMHLLPGEALRFAALLQSTADLAVSEECPAWCEVAHRGPIRNGRIHSLTTYDDSFGLVCTAQQAEAPDGQLGELVIRTYDEAAGILASKPLVSA
jgi:hypothetical protein